jgi:hypothetical protein
MSIVTLCIGCAVSRDGVLLVFKVFVSGVRGVVMSEERESQAVEIPKSRSQRVCMNQITFIKTLQSGSEDSLEVVLSLKYYVILA